MLQNCCFYLPHIRLPHYFQKKKKTYAFLTIVLPFVFHAFPAMLSGLHDSSALLLLEIYSSEGWPLHWLESVRFTWLRCALGPPLSLVNCTMLHVTKIACSERIGFHRIQLCWLVLGSFSPSKIWFTFVLYGHALTQLGFITSNFVDYWWVFFSFQIWFIFLCDHVPY